ncbi:sensor histidine kinase [Chelativorans salis]|uniref:histidine kinase n=1 Tax=Chelativorans salis TaxID=2978478 RepID=A0ABT2LJM5_9HYPH|nr:sensor histidine kinase [Chelativorans sp. EGI FJ00035]MCT7374544.1 sensor histidine kinase [Chelativorans sp. EGI FJ00035]
MAKSDAETGDIDAGPVAGLGERLRTRLSGPKPIGFFLFLLIAVTIIPALAISTVLLQRNNDAQREVVNTLAEAMASSIAEAVDGELRGMIMTLRVLSTTPSLAAGNVEDFYERARLALASSGSHLVLFDENLRQLMNTREPYGAPLGPASDPATLQRALAERAPAISGVFREETSGEWMFNATLPYIQQNRPPRLLVTRRNAETMADALSQQMLRGGWNAALLDRYDRVIASSFMSSDVGKPFFLDIPSGFSPQTVRAVGDGAESYLAIVEEASHGGWKVVAWAPTAAVEEPMRRSLRQLFGGTIIIITIGAGAAWALGRQIAKPVRRLADDARRLGAGEQIEASVYPVAEITTVSVALAEAAGDRKKAEGEIRLLMREVAHRAKNQLTVVSAMAKQTARHAGSLSTFLDSFQKRLYGLARSTDLLIAGGAWGVELRALILAQVDPFKPETAKRLELSGPLFRLSNQAAQTLGVAFHELATNAAKYGAFATRTGRLVISWRVEDDILTIVWREHVVKDGGRRLAKRGFGTEIIERMVGGTLDAEISRTFHRDGLEYIFQIPVKRLLPDHAHLSSQESLR